MDRLRAEYWIPKHRYYELKHFCLQYNDWKREYDILTSCSERPDEDPTAKRAVQLADYARSISLIDECLHLANPAIVDQLRGFITSGISPYEVPTDIFWHSYRRFFWLLDKRKGL